MKLEWIDQYGVLQRILIGDQAARLSFGEKDFIELFADCLKEDGYDPGLEEDEPPVKEGK